VSEKGGLVPLVRYFVVITGALLAMLAAANWYLPSPPPEPSAQLQVDKSGLQIRSEHKWPQKIEFDTAMQPFIAPSAPASAAAVPTVAEVRPEKPALDALAQAKPSEPEIAKPKPRVRTARRATRSAPRVVVAANPAAPQWPFGWGEPAAGPTRPSLDAHTSSRYGMFAERNRQRIVSWSSGSFSDW
jgi:hypothetical protein